MTGILVGFVSGFIIGVIVIFIFSALVVSSQISEEERRHGREH